MVPPFVLDQTLTGDQGQCPLHDILSHRAGWRTLRRVPSVILLRPQSVYDETQASPRSTFPGVFLHIRTIAKIRSPGEGKQVVIELPWSRAFTVAAAGASQGSGENQRSEGEGDESAHGGYYSAGQYHDKEMHTRPTTRASQRSLTR